MSSVYGFPGDSQQQTGGDCLPGWIVMTGERPGMEYVASPDGEWIPAPAPVPGDVSRWQLREALRLSTLDHGAIAINDTSAPSDGKRDLLQVAEEALADPATPAYYRTAWAELAQIERDSSMLLAVADALGLTAANLDDLFIFGRTLRA